MSGHQFDEAGLRLASIVESSDDAIISKDLDGVVLSWNRAAERMFGYSPAEMIGQSIRRIIPPDRQGEEDEVLFRIRRGEKVDHFETLRQRKDGTLVPVSLTVSALRAADGRVVGASKIARDISERRDAEAERTRLLADARQQAEITDRVNRVGRLVASTLDRATILQAVTDIATDVTGAEFGAFFYNAGDDASGDSYLLYTLSGAPKEAFANFPQPRATEIFGPTFRGEGTVRLVDVTKDPRYGRNAPYHGMPVGHLPVRSYLAVSVKARSGEVLGGLFFGHGEPGVFTERDEQLAEGIAAWASVALENSRLHVGVQEASRLKDEFLATLSHELRTPLNAILGYSRMISAGLLTGNKERRAIETIERNAGALTQIVEDILDVSRIISGKIRLTAVPVNFSEVINAAVESVQPAADAKGVTLDVLRTNGACTVSGDAERLQQVVWNVVANAVKFTPRGGRVEVACKEEDDQAEVKVTDTGIGIAPEFLPFVFERFRQADSATTRERGGLGLGLSIARHIVELHGGTIIAESAGKSSGSTFRILLPLKKAEKDAPSSPARDDAEPGRLGGVPDLRGIRVVAVDDDPDALMLVREILEATGADVRAFASARQALHALEVALPDVLVSDLAMPQMDGFELISQIRGASSESLRALPAAAFTAYARSEDKTKALRSGFQVHLAKPIDPEILMTTVAALAKRPT